MEQITPYLAIWGCIVSSVLASIKIYETYHSRKRLLIKGYSFTSSYEEGNAITLSNPSSTPFMIDCFRLFWVGIKGMTDIEPVELWEDYGWNCNIVIPPYSNHTLEFCNESHFQTHNDKKLYIQIVPVAAKPFNLLVYPFQTLDIDVRSN